MSKQNSHNALHFLSLRQLPGVNQLLDRFKNQKFVFKFVAVSSVMLAGLSLFVMQIVRPTDGRAILRLSEAAQSIQLQTAISLPTTESETAPLASSAQGSSEDSNSNPNVQVVINGEKIPVPSHGTIHKEVQTPGSQSSVNVTVQDGQVTSTQTQTNGFTNNTSYSYSFSSSNQINTGSNQ